MADEPSTAVDEQPNEAAAEKGGSNLLTAVMWSVLGLVLGAGGFSIPFFFPGLFGNSPVQDEASEVSEVVETDYIDFGETVVNLNSDKLNRYLKVDITLLVNKGDKLEIEAQLNKRKAVLKSWLLSHLSDASMTDIRGAAGQNQLKREIQDHFNTVLFTDGYDRIHEVLFQEFNIQ